VTTWKARLSVLAVFLLGTVCGGAAVRLYTLRIQREILHSPNPLAMAMVLQLSRELDLSSEQQEQIRTAIGEIREETLQDQEMQMLIIPKVRQVIDKGEQRIRPILNDEQRARFDALVAERRKMLDQMQRKSP
jgi:uncharacterized membrane protein